MSDNVQTDLYQNGPSTSDLFMRRWSLTLMGPGGSITLSDSNAGGAESGGDSTIDDSLRIVFQTRQINTSSRGRLEATVYNLRLDRFTNLAKNYNRVILQAGYQTGRFGTIFDGTIIKFKQGREETLVDTYLKIWAQDGDFPYNLATVNFRLKAGSTAVDAVNRIVQSMEALGAKIGKIVGISTVPFARGITVYGQALDQLLKFGATFIQNGVLNVYDPKQQFAIGEDIKYDSLHGLVGMPEATANGVELNCLLNPTLQVRGTVIIDQKDINRFAAGGTSAGATGGGTSVQGPGFTEIGWFTNTTADGRYTVFVIEHNGDSRGKPWYSHVVAYPEGQSFAPGSDLPYYNFGPTPGQTATVNEPPALTPDSNFNTLRGGTGPTQIPPGG